MNPSSPIDLRTTWTDLHKSGTTERRLPLNLPDNLEIHATLTHDPPRWTLDICDRNIRSAEKFPGDLIALVGELNVARRCRIAFDPSEHECTTIWPHLAEDILKAIEEKPTNPGKAILAAFKKWPYWPRQKAPKFGKEVLQGLFAELWLLNWWLDRGLAPLFTVNAWQGPSSRLHDFQFGSVHVEVKSKSGGGRKVTIVNLDQLDDKGCDIVYLAFVRVKAVVRKSHSLGELVEKLEARLDGNALHLFHKKLALMRWFQMPENIRAETQYSVHEPEFFKVGELFPRLISRPASHPQHFPPKGVHVTRYQIDVPTSDHVTFESVGTAITEVKKREMIETTMESPSVPELLYDDDEDED